MELDILKLNCIVSDRKMSKEAFAERAGLSHAAASRILAGKTKPRLSTIGRIAEALGVRSIELVKA